MWIINLLIVCLLGAEGINQEQHGPDPWDIHSHLRPDDTDIPPDIRLTSPRRQNSEQTHVGDYFFKRLLTIILKNGAVETEGDGSRDISVLLKVTSDHWNVLDDLMKSDKPLTEEMYRRSVGYISDSIVKPSYKEKVVKAWSEYVLSNYEFYRDEIIWVFIFVTIVLSLLFISKYTSMKKLLWIILFTLLYLIEAVLSYKEFNKQEYDKFISALYGRKWGFWSSTHDGMPDWHWFDLELWKHMHPSKICVRMLGHFFTEPMLLISSCVNQISNEITRDLWPPFNSIINGILIFLFHVVFIVLIVMLISTYLLNRAFNVSFLAGLVNFGTNNSNPTSNNFVQNDRRTSSGADRISGENLSKLIYILSNKLDTPINKNNLSAIDGKPNSARGRPVNRLPALKYRSHSTGRLQNGNVLG